MKPEEFLNKEKKVGGSESVEICCVDYLNTDYLIKLYPSETATKTGLVKFGELISKQSDFPTFTFRWDQNKETLDVDIYTEGELKSELWSKQGYQGHHPQKEEGDPRRYKLDIAVPNKQIFTGTITVGLRFELQLRSGLHLGGSLEIKKIQKLN
jgi:hypothetical protein